MTPGISPAQCRDVLRRILGEELGLLEQLAVQLLKEHTCVVANDIEGLERSSAARQDCVASLMKLNDERRDLCRLVGKGTDLAGLSSLVAWCDPEGELAEPMRIHAERSGACRAQNERNGALVGARMARLSSMLGLLAGKDAAAPVYGRSGNPGPQAPLAGRLVATSA